jgi:hypothetical protein
MCCAAGHVHSSQWLAAGPPKQAGSCSAVAVGTSLPAKLCDTRHNCCTPTRCLQSKIPPYNGYGSLDDSHQNCVALVPKPPKKVGCCPPTPELRSGVLQRVHEAMKRLAGCLGV